MIWDSWSAFFHMGGYGFYVWGSFLITLICLVGEIGLNARRKRTLLAQLNQMLRLSQQDQRDKHET